MLVSWLIGISLCIQCTPDWGFFGHRKINRHAVYTIPPPLNQFFKKHIAWVEEHGVDADKRRYAIPQEYKRHYIDLDYHVKGDSMSLSFDLDEEIRKRLKIKVVLNKGDTITFAASGGIDERMEKWITACPGLLSNLTQLVDTLRKHEPYEEVWQCPPELISTLGTTCGMTLPWKSILIEDHFSPHGILPYWLEIMQKRLTTAFYEKNIPLILRLAADIGHYIGDAHVPLHTTENYNGQLTQQHGIHGFWESRIPELFFEEWDLLTGPAVYIPDFREKAWATVLHSHEMVHQVLSLEKEVRFGLPEDKIMCFEDRNTTNMLTYCPGFARAYAEALNGMVENQFKASIHMIGSAWYSAWIDAGQPNLWENETEALAPVTTEEISPGLVPLGRPHD